MEKIIVLLCLWLIGCATVGKGKEGLHQESKKYIAVNPEEVDSAISVFSAAIRNNPNYAGAYYNRAIAYFHRNDYEKCWRDVHKAESLGLNFSPDFIKALKEASKREN